MNNKSDKVLKESIQEAFSPKDVCSICDSEYDEDEGGIQGHFGICPVTFCVWCYSSIVDMVMQSHDCCEECEEQEEEGE
mgnify:FL=1|jgi:hypothetical protein